MSERRKNSRMRRTSDCPWLSEKTSADGYVVDTWSMILVPSANNNSCTYIVLVFVAQFLEDLRSGFYGRGFAVRLGIHLEGVMHDVRNGLRVCSGARTTAVDAVVYMSEFVGDTIRLFTTPA